MHRDINRNGVDRYAIPLFFGTDYDVKLEVRAFYDAFKPLRADTDHSAA